MKDATPRQQLVAFMSKFTPEVQSVAKKALAKMRKRAPGAMVLVYDNYNALAIGFAPTDRASDVVFSIALYPRWVSLFFLNGAKLRDPSRILKGSGTPRPAYRPPQSGRSRLAGSRGAHRAGERDCGDAVPEQRPRPDDHQVRLGQAAAAQASVGQGCD